MPGGALRHPYSLVSKLRLRRRVTPEVTSLGNIKEPVLRRRWREVLGNSRPVSLLPEYNQIVIKHRSLLYPTGSPLYELVTLAQYPHSRISPLFGYLSFGCYFPSLPMGFAESRLHDQHRRKPRLVDPFRATPRLTDTDRSR